MQFLSLLTTSKTASSVLHAINRNYKVHLSKSTSCFPTMHSKTNTPSLLIYTHSVSSMCLTQLPPSSNVIFPLLSSDQILLPVPPLCKARPHLHLRKPNIIDPSQCILSGTMYTFTMNASPPFSFSMPAMFLCPSFAPCKPQQLTDVCITNSLYSPKLTNIIISRHLTTSCA